jgi:hypothetical protein
VDVSGQNTQKLSSLQRLLWRSPAADLVENWDLDLAECQSGFGGSNGRVAAMSQIRSHVTRLM